MNTTVAELESQLKNNQEAMERRDMALKLFKNREFKKLILDYFCTEECARYAQLSADPSLKPENRADALALAQAAGHLRRWLSIQVQMGNHAESQMDALREEITEVSREEI